MFAIGIELMLECSGCWRPVPLNALVAQVECPHCGRVLPIGAEAWKALVAAAIEQGPGLQPGEGRTATAMAAGARAVLVFQRCAPACSACKNELSLGAALQEARSTSGWARCSRCGAWLAVRPPPVPLSDSVTFLLGEEAKGADSRQAPDAMQPVSFSCQKCGAVLRVDGTARMVTCQYCSAAACLPEDLWEKLHPVTGALRWYLLYDEQVERSGQPRLEAREGSIAGQVFPLRGTDLSVGRTSESDICIPSGTLSKNHARIMFREGAWWVVDMKSANGTRVNQERITAPRKVGPGDKISFGDVTLILLGSA